MSGCGAPRAALVPGAPLPLCGAAAEAFMREVERDVLDRAHERLRMSRLPAEHRSYALLAAFDSMIYCIEPASGAPTLGTVQAIKSLVDGFSYAMRSISADAGPLGCVPTNLREHIESAGDSLIPCAQYARVASMHQSYGRALVGVDADDAGRIVRFTYLQQGHPGLGVFGYADLVRSSLRATNEASARVPWDRIARNIARSGYDLDGGRVVFAAPEILGDGVAPSLQPPDSDHLISLPDDTDLCGFSAGELRRFWAYIRAWGRSALMAYQGCFESGVPQPECMPTQVVRIGDFMTAVETAIRVPRAIVAAIVQRLTFDPEEAKRDVFLRPFLVERETIAWSPLVIELTHPVRNTLKVMSRTTTYRRVAANLIGGRERALLDATERVLSSAAPYRFVRNRLMNVGDVKSEIDLLAFSPAAPSQVLVVQAKAGLAADDINEVHSASIELALGQRQATACIRGLQRMSPEQRASVAPNIPWRGVTKYAGLVVSAANEPNSLIDQSRVPAISLQSILDRVPVAARRTPLGLVRACRERNWQARASDLAELYEEVRIGDVTYQLPSFERTPEVAGNEHG